MCRPLFAEVLKVNFGVALFCKAEWRRGNEGVFTLTASLQRST